MEADPESVPPCMRVEVELDEHPRTPLNVIASPHPNHTRVRHMSFTPKRLLAVCLAD